MSLISHLEKKVELKARKMLKYKRLYAWASLALIVFNGIILIVRIRRIIKLEQVRRILKAEKVRQCAAKCKGKGSFCQ